MIVCNLKVIKGDSGGLLFYKDEADKKLKALGILSLFCEENVTAYFSSFSECLDVRKFELPEIKLSKKKKNNNKNNNNNSNNKNDNNNNNNNNNINNNNNNNNHNNSSSYVHEKLLTETKNTTSSTTSGSIK
jgi:hypothetical protein